MSLFPVKVRELVDNLRTSGALRMMANCAKAAPEVAYPDDGKTRILLCEAATHLAVTARFGLEHLRGLYRIRVAVPEGVTKLFVPEETMLEVYHGRHMGELLHSVSLPELDERTATCVEVELCNGVTRAKAYYKDRVPA